jgi:ribonuclease VapC
MIVDSSAILAIALQEPEAIRFASAIVQAPARYMSSVNWLETMMVIEARAGALAADDVRLILGQLAVEALPFDAAHMHEAHDARRRYALNLGDCCAYAASKIEGAPLLFKGEDFAKTDVENVLW